MCCQPIHLRQKTASPRHNGRRQSLVLFKAASELLGLISEGLGDCLYPLPLLAIFLHDIYFDILIMLIFENEAISVVSCGHGACSLRTV